MGSYLSRELRKAGLEIGRYNRSPKDGWKSLEELRSQVVSFDLILLCVSDKAIQAVSELLPTTDVLLAHVAGAAPLGFLNENHNRRAVFYPLMSITADSQLSLTQIPFCLEATSEPDLEILENLVHEIGAKSYRINSEQRKYLHLAAVIGQNFTNHLYHKAFDILSGQNIDSSVLMPLLEKSLTKLHRHKPADLQTGPALRQDNESMQKHLDLLDRSIDKDIYSLLSKSIQQTHDEKL